MLGSGPDSSSSWVWPNESKERREEEGGRRRGGGGREEGRRGERGEDGGRRGKWGPVSHGPDPFWNYYFEKSLP